MGTASLACFQSCEFLLYIPLPISAPICLRTAIDLTFTLRINKHKFDFDVQIKKVADYVQLDGSHASVKQ